MTLKNKKLIEVCSECLTASCWYGEFMCDESLRAGTTIKTVGELRKLKREHPDNWIDKKLIEVYGEIPSFKDKEVTN